MDAEKTFLSPVFALELTPGIHEHGSEQKAIHSEHGRRVSVPSAGATWLGATPGCGVAPGASGGARRLSRSTTELGGFQQN